MKKYETEIIKFIEPVYLFCLKRVNNRYDAQDLASEIMVHVLDGMNKYRIKSLEAWVWRIAHNRYARFINMKKNRYILASDKVLFDIGDDYDFVDEIAIADEYETVFRYLHTLSSEYRNILVDYYIGDMKVKTLSEKYSLTETTIKWRLNVSRQKIRDRIGENKMEKVYKRINWNTTCCNGLMNPNAYLCNQIARAICEAAYEKPLTIEEISMKTGLPTMYIEDELPRLIYGDAIEKDGNKYSTNFIILRLNDKEAMEKQFALLIKDVADYFENQFKLNLNAIGNIGFYGSNFGIRRLGYIAVPAALRGKIAQIKDGILGLDNGAYPPRKDGGYGWYIVEESKDADDVCCEYNTGCNIAGQDTDFIYYFHIQKYFNTNIYHNEGTRWLSINKIFQKSTDGVIPEGLLSEDDIIRLLQINLIKKSGSEYKLNFACFTQEQYGEFSSIFKVEDEMLDKILTELIMKIHKSFKCFTPKRLNGQINQWVSCYVHTMIGYVIEELIRRDTLERPEEEKPLTNGVFCIKGKYVTI